MTAGRLVGSMYGVHPKGTPVPSDSVGLQVTKEASGQQQEEVEWDGQGSAAQHGNRKIIRPA